MPKPHILFLFTDQQRADCLSCAGHPVLETPHMDRLAAEGVRFTNCFTTSPLCVPARQTVMTGLYPHNSNMWQNDAETPVDADTYVGRLRAAGYRTCGIGKHHLFRCNKGANLYEHESKFRAIGFDHVEPTGGTWSNTTCNSPYTDYLKSFGLLDGFRQYLLELEARPDAERRYTAEALPLPAEHYPDAFAGRRVEAYVDEYGSDEPSLVYVGFQGPHEPWDAPDAFSQFDTSLLPDPIPELPQGEWLPDISRWYHRWAQYYPPSSPQALRAIACRYLGKIAQIDAEIGRILAAYERKGWLDNTVVVFASDHGEMLGDLNRLSKSVCYDSAIRVPMIVRLPDGVGSGTTRNGFVETIDIHGTILDAAGCEPLPGTDALSVLPMVRGSDDDRLRTDVLAEVHAHYMLRTQRWKIIIGRDGQSMALFDLEEDPLEQRNYCGHPDYKQAELEMRSRLLGRLTAGTYRPGNVDPELSAHGHAGPDAGNLWTG